MTYLDTYRAYVRFTDGSEFSWSGLRKTQAKWRYHWINRTIGRDCRFQGKTFKEFGWGREFQA